MSAIETVSAVVCRIGELPALAPAQDIYEAGLESVRALEVLLDLESEFSVSIPDEEFMNCRTAESLAALVTRLQQGA
ncbi:MAG: acyl carrier protein [Gemmatimonadales bacterium]